MTIVIVLIAVLAIVAAVVVASRIGGTHVGRLGRSRRPPAGDGSEESRFRGRRRRSYDEHVLLREGEEIQQRVEAQVARDRARTHDRFRLKGRAVADQLAVPHDPLAPGVGAPDHRIAEPGYADPAYGDPRYPDPGHAHPVDEFGRPLTGRSRVEEDSAEEELRLAAARARAANAGSIDGGPVGPHGRRRLWSPRPRRGTPPPPVDGRDGRFVP